MITKTLTFKDQLKIPNVNSCTNIGGVAVSGDRTFVIKTRQDDVVSTIYLYEKKKLIETHKYTNKLGHGNGLAYGNQYLAVPSCGQYMNLISLKDWSCTRYKSKRPISSIAYKGSGIWLVKSKKEICEVKLDKEVTFLKSYPLYDYVRTFTISQDITYSKGKLYHVFSDEKKMQNCIVISRIDKKLIVEKVYISEPKTSLYEWESPAIVGDSVIIAANTNAGDYLYTGDL